MRWWLKVRAVRRQIPCLWFLLLGLALVALGFLDLASDPDGTLPKDKQPPRIQTFKRLPPEETRPDLEVIVDSRDPAADHRTAPACDVGLSPLAFSAEERAGLIGGVRSASGIKCLGEQYSESLPSASVVICVQDPEAWSTLVRTVRSVLHTAPDEHLPGCRSLGASVALGEVLVFMDSHCECHAGWLEPLLERVAQDRSPALGGGVLAIDRHFFLSVGGYDPGMLLSGAEQIELSIRVWSCGGSMEVVPCSRVAHLSPPAPTPPPPATPPDPELLHKDKIRLADTWMDAYGKIFYRRDTLAHFIRQSESPNITEQHCELNSQGEVRWGPAGALCFDARGERVILSPCPTRQPTRSRLQWRFLKLSGQLIHMETQLCVEARREEESDGLFLCPCIHHPRQQWHFEQLVAP
ncbi:hypothetical protein CRUP_013004 [Coryphaenoides rupestris]|nr:hypothetical protein CRUP_013004 [Coryphaenoides rupestris]